MYAEIETVSRVEVIKRSGGGEGARDVIHRIVKYCTGWGRWSRTWVWLTKFWEFPRLVGRSCS